MSDITGFSRARRIAAAKKAAAIEAEKQKDDICLSDMSIRDLKLLCDTKGIKHKSKATKEELIKLLEG